MRVAKNPFNLKERLGTLETEEAVVIPEEDHEGKATAPVEHNLIWGPVPVPTTPKVVPRSLQTKRMIR